METTKLSENNNNLNEQVIEKVQDIYKQVHIVEACDVIVNDIKDKKMVFISDDNQTMTELGDLLDSNQLENAKNIVIAMLNGNKSDAEEILQGFLQFDVKEKTKKFGDGQEDTEEDPEEPEEDAAEKELDESIKAFAKELFADEKPKKQEKKQEKKPEKKQEVKETKSSAGRPGTEMAKVDVAKARAFRMAGWSYVKIGDEFGVSPKVVARVLKKEGIE